MKVKVTKGMVDYLKDPPKCIIYNKGFSLKEGEPLEVMELDEESGLYSFRTEKGEGFSMPKDVCGLSEDVVKAWPERCGRVVSNDEVFWRDVRIQAAIAFEQALLSHKDFLPNKKVAAGISVEYADTLVDELKKKKE